MVYLKKRIDINLHDRKENFYEKHVAYNFLRGWWIYKEMSNLQRKNKSLKQILLYIQQKINYITVVAQW